MEITTLADKKEYYIQKGIKRYYYPAENVKEFVAELKGELSRYDENLLEILEIIDELTGDLN